MKVSFHGESKDGRLIIYNRADMLSYIRNIGDTDLKVTIQKRSRRRSGKQNSYYWAVVVPVVYARLVEYGWDVTVEETHDFLKDRFCRREYIVPETGEVLSVIKETKSFSTVEFNDYVDRVIRFAAETLDVQVPYPNEQVELF